jgi:hypothetical protein
VNDAPKLLIEWSSPWHEFRTAIRPALARSPRRLAGEAHTELFPYRGILLTWLVEGAFLLAAAIIPAKLASMQPHVPRAKEAYDVIYYSGDELPQTPDNGGTQAGRAGSSGGREAFHRTQTIRVARGASLRQQVVDAPNLKLPHSDSAVANLLAYNSVPGPPPAEGLPDSRTAPIMQTAVVPPAPQMEANARLVAPVLSTSIVAPAPDVRVQPRLVAPMMSANVVAPAPNLTDNNLAVRVPGASSVQVVPPPVSAPERITSFKSRLTLPAPNPVAPPPRLPNQEAEYRAPRFGTEPMTRQIVPPPVQLPSGSLAQQTAASLGNRAVVPPPVQLSGNFGEHDRLGTLAGKVSAVPPSVQLGDVSDPRSRVPSMGSKVSVVAPPPDVSAAALSSGRGRGARGAGTGGPTEFGSALAPPSHPTSERGTGIVVSSQPGTKVGVPGNGSPGTLAMSPSGSANVGAGGSGGGTGINHGRGPGSGFAGTETGAAKEGAGLGSDPNARSGISPYAGTGGAGSGTSRTSPLPGVSVEGGNIVTLPSFGPDGSQSGAPGRSSTKTAGEGPGIEVVATSRSGGAFNFYGLLKGDKVYTIYIDTALGTAVMQFADPTSVNHAYAQELTAPTPMRAAVPSGLPHARLVIACVLDRSGLVRNPRVLDTTSATMTSKVLAALNSWKFSPVMRGAQPVEVNAILGFNIDTSDRF